MALGGVLNSPFVSRRRECADSHLAFNDDGINRTDRLLAGRVVMFAVVGPRKAPPDAANDKVLGAHVLLVRLAVHIFAHHRDVVSDLRNSGAFHFQRVVSFAATGRYCNKSNSHIPEPFDCRSIGGMDAPRLQGVGGARNTLERVRSYLLDAVCSVAN